jgi:predicted CoA-substrate-specific enzyme activase
MASRASFVEGWNIGSVSIKRVRLYQDGAIRAEVCRHAGDPERAIRPLLEQPADFPAAAVATGPEARSLFTLPYLPESICIESALRHLALSPDMVVSLGGETFLVYCIAGGSVRRAISSNRCAAGSGEFLAQQFRRMNLDFQAGLAAARQGRRVSLASRCSVHCQSDATHKLNKGDCTPADIARSLIAELAAKIAILIQSTGWPRARVLLTGGLAGSEQLVKDLADLLPDAQFEVSPHSGYFEALGAAAAAQNPATLPPGPLDTWLELAGAHRFPTRLPLSRFTHQVTRIEDGGLAAPRPGIELILGLDAGSTTTKAVLLDRASGRVVAGCYLRTHGNPVGASFECLAELHRQMAGVPYRVVQAAATGSGREIVSLYLDRCLIFNEILAHARAAREVAPDVDTLFEIGGQDAKFVALEAGMPVDYSMNDGCSAGTGSFLEEAAASDMQVPIQQIGPLALMSDRPIAFGERCAAFINSEVRAALQQGVPRADVLAGLVYAILDNYLSRVVGARQIGRKVLMQGGVALNPAVAPAAAAITGLTVVVPPRPELMGCEGAARMAGDLLDAGTVPAWDRQLSSLGRTAVQIKAPFACPSCENKCEVQRIAIGDRTHAFGGLCSKWEIVRRPKNLRRPEGRDLIALRQQIMFTQFAPSPCHQPRARVGLPLALTTYELYPLYSKFLSGLGCQVILSRPGHGSRRTNAPVCYPGELMHAAMDDLLAAGLDFVFLPYMHEFPPPPGQAHSYLCPVTQDMPGVIREFFAGARDKILTPEMGLASHLAATTEEEVARLAWKLAVPEDTAIESWRVAREHQAEFERTYRQAIADALQPLEGPAVLLVGRPYAAYAPEVNLSVPRKIASRGFTVIPGDALPAESPIGKDVWHFTQRVLAAAHHARRHPDRYICNLSCFSCGPDAVVHHRLRRELEGQPFCFLEIDSHTAHAGIETRIGAFLDIIEARRFAQVARAGLTRKRPVPARLLTESGGPVIVTGAGKRIRLDAPQTLHVLLADTSPLLSELLVGVCAHVGWRACATPLTSAEILQRARTLCSGRECLPFLSMIGKAVQYLETRDPGETTVFHLLEQDDACQIGDWPDAVQVLFERLGEENAVVTWPRLQNNYLGKGDRFASAEAAAIILSDLMAEIASSLRCLAQDRAAALALLHELERDLIAASRRGLLAMERALRRAAHRLAPVSLRIPLRQAPRVLLFGGINRIFVDGPVREFFEERGILTKTTEVSEFLSFFEAHSIVRLGFSRGYIKPAQQCSPLALTRQLLPAKDRRAAWRALRARVHIGFIETLDRRWRRIAGRSGLLFNPQATYAQVAAEGHERISMNSYTEAPMTVGRYAAMRNSGAYDGFVNIGAFNCAPANSASAVVHSLSLQTDAPYAIIEADGSSITPSQMRQLETVAAQAQRRRATLLAAGPALP